MTTKGKGKDNNRSLRDDKQKVTANANADSLRECQTKSKTKDNRGFPSGMTTRKDGGQIGANLLQAWRVRNAWTLWMRSPDRRPRLVPRESIRWRLVRLAAIILSIP